MQSISIGAGAAGFNFLPVFLAQRCGLFARRGLEVTVKRTGTTDKATAALATRELDLAITPPEGAIADFASGGTLRVIAGNLNKLPLTLVAQSKYRCPEELRGAVLGTSSLKEGTALYTMEMLARHGLKYPGDYQFSLVGVHTARWEALKSGALDAALQLVPLNFVALDQGFANLGQAYEYLPHVAFISMVVQEGWAQENRESIVGVLAALIEATAMIYDQANDALCIELVNEVTRTEPKYVRMSLELLQSQQMMPRDLSIPAPALATSVQIMLNAGLLPSHSVRDPHACIDDSFRQQALEQTAH